MHSFHVKKKKVATCPQLNRHIYEPLLFVLSTFYTNLQCRSGWPVSSAWASVQLGCGGRRVTGPAAGLTSGSSWQGKFMTVDENKLAKAPEPHISPAPFPPPPLQWCGGTLRSRWYRHVVTYCLSFVYMICVFWLLAIWKFWYIAHWFTPKSLLLYWAVGILWPKCLKNKIKTRTLS